MNLLFSRLLRDFIDRKHRFVAGSQVNDRAQRSEPPTVDFVSVVASKRSIERSLSISRYDYQNSSHWTRSFFLSPFFSFSFLLLLLLFFPFLSSHSISHVPSRNFSFKTDQRVHLLFLRSMLHDRLTYKPRTG